MNYKEFANKVLLVAAGFAASKLLFNQVRGSLGV
jgi:hypothetical protein